MNHSIFHAERFGVLGQTIRLNLRAVRLLLNYEVPHFSSLSKDEKALLQRRFKAYCKHGNASFSNGNNTDIPPSINNLPCVPALEIALQIQ